jgi:polyhydroxyalkanoate synthesis regulator protein
MPIVARQPILVKLYARSRLYDPAGLRYVTIDMLRAWSRLAVAFVVVDAQTGEDITAVLLA